MITRGTLGWHEPIALLDYGIERAYAKLDTGSDHSVLHALDIVKLSRDRAEFALPLLLDQKSCAEFEPGGPRRFIAHVVDERIVRSSNGAEQTRPVVETRVTLAGQTFSERFSLTDRRGMRFAVLLGRSALADRFLIDSGRAHTLESERECEPESRRPAEVAFRDRAE